MVPDRSRLQAEVVASDGLVRGHLPTLQFYSAIAILTSAPLSAKADASRTRWRSLRFALTEGQC
jgi:hypothetical protein